MFFEVKEKETVSASSKGCLPTPGPKHEACSQLPGTVLRVFIPAGAVINLLNLIEITSPSGICLIIRLPFLGGKCKDDKYGGGWGNLLDVLRQAGATVEMVKS